jgi:hypothetical protein
VRRALSLVPADAHIMRSMRDRASLRAQRPYNPRAYPPRAPHPSALRLAPSAVDAHLAGGAAAVAEAQDTTDAVRSLDADLARIAWRAPERADVLDRASAPSLLSARREVERAQARRCCLVVGMPAALAFQARTRGHPACVRGLPLLPVRATAGAPRHAATPFRGYGARARARTCAPLGGLWLAW